MSRARLIPPASTRAVTPQRGVPTNAVLAGLLAMTSFVLFSHHGNPATQKEIYFISINCEERFKNQLALPNIAEGLFETVRHRQEKFLWWPYLFLLMPDHLHALLSFPPSGKPLRLVISKWKEWTAKEFGMVWQRDFFEHRLRQDESRREKADYILRNPVRKNLVTRAEDWPFVYFGDGKRPDFK